MSTAVEIREIPGWRGKYWLDDRLRVWRRTEDGELYRLQTSGCPRRVRLYAHGYEQRVYVHKLAQQVFPDRPEIAAAAKSPGVPPGEGGGGTSC